MFCICIAMFFVFCEIKYTIFNDAKKYILYMLLFVGLEARGFLFGPQIASNLGKPFVPIRKKGKLPGKCISVESSKEYGKVGIL